METLIFIIELIGTSAFAITGVYAACAKGLDIFGALVLGCLTACGGGVLRDLLLGLTPPNLFLQPIYISVAAVTSILTLVVLGMLGKHIEKHQAVFDHVINVFDALGLAVFVLVGMQIALSAGHGDNAFLVITVGVLTGIGGGVTRDLLCASVPAVLHKRVYAVAAVLGGALYYWLPRAGVDDGLAMLLSAALVITIRILATVFRWNLPHIRR